MDKIKIEELIEKSGNSFHFDVVRYLREKGWTTLVSPYYTDNFTDKPREIDIIAEKKFDYYDFNRIIGTINVQLLIECKYINELTVFWFDAVEKEKLGSKLVNDAHLDNSGPLKNYELAERLLASHHHLKDEAAKLFATQKSKTSEQEIIYKAINQILNSIVYFRNKGSLIKGSFVPVFNTVRYPIVICKNFRNFYRADNKSNIADSFILEINYAYPIENGGDKEEYFIVDIVNFEKIDNYLDNIEKDEIPQVMQFVRH